MTENLFAEYYSKIFSVKNYADEVNSILAIYDKIKGNMPLSVIDIGCGTGGHSIQFAENGIRTIGVDNDPTMIEQARKVNYRDSLDVIYINVDIGNINNSSKFDLAVSLFNVVNYIPSLADLNTFLTDISNVLTDNGVYIFDCWNGVAALLDPPKEKKSVITDENGNEISCNLIPENYPMEQKTILNYNIKKLSSDEQETITHSFEHYLWTPSILKELLHTAGFQEVQIFPLFDFVQS